jgi:3-isopropylmalate/(R)-2-methylmalate dehydratase large subunit
LGYTVVENFFLNHRTSESLEVASGRVVWIRLDIRSARDFGGASVVKHIRNEYPGETLENPAGVLFTFDCVAPANNIPYATNQQICREFAKAQGLKLFDVDAGIGSHVLIERGYALPNSTLVGTDSHMNILGAVGAFGQGMGDQDIAFAFRTGMTWFEVPETLKVKLTGRLRPPVSAKDLTLLVLKKLGTVEALGKAIEYEGEAVERLDLAGRITLASMATEMGAIISFITPSRDILDFLKARSGKGTLSPVLPDPDARYGKEIEIDVSDLKPQIAAPPNPANVHDVEELEGKPIQSVFVGSCTNGRIEDFRTVAGILKGRTVSPGVILILVPATKEVYGEMLREGLVQTLFEAGAVVSHPGCGGCASGQLGMTGKGEVQVSTSNRNFPGKQGAGETYLASPATAAASALFGRITSPEKVRVY